MLQLRQDLCDLGVKLQDLLLRIRLRKANRVVAMKELDERIEETKRSLTRNQS
jgi:hypothetical protein